MKRLDQLKKLRGMSTDDLTKRSDEISHELMNLRFRKRSGQLTNPAQIRNSKRELARVKNLLGASRRAAAQQG